jgi:hypothetical protein
LFNKIQRIYACCLSPLLSSSNTPTRVAKGASPSAHQQRDGALFNALVDNTRPSQNKIIYTIPNLILRLSPEIIPANDQTGFFTNVISTPGFTSYYFQNFYGFRIKSPTQKGWLIAVGEHLPKVRAIDEISQTKEIVSDPKLKEELDSLKIELVTDLAKQVPNFTIRRREDVLKLIRDIVLSLGETWNEENIAKVIAKMNEYSFS